MRLLLLPLLLAALPACRGQISDKPPVHLNPNMDTQDKFKAYGENTFFADGRNMRLPPSGTVARGSERADDAWWLAMDENQDWLTAPPECSAEKTTDCVDVNMAFMKRGQARYGIFCAPCHGLDGHGNGMVVQRKQGLPPVPNFHDKTRAPIPMGQLVHIIGYGERAPAMGDIPAQAMTMPGYAVQISMADRWAIAGYVLALKRSQNAKPEDVEGKL